MTRSVVISADFVRLNGFEEQLRIMQEESRRNLELMREEIKQCC